MSKRVQEEIVGFLRRSLDERLEQLTEDQRAFFHKVLPGKVKNSDLEMAIDLCDRTIAAAQRKSS